MIASFKSFRLAQLPLAARTVITCFVLLAGVGYLVSVLYLLFTYSPGNGSFVVTPADVRKKLAGDRDHTVLEGKIGPGGSMAQYVKDPADGAKIVAWVHGGAKEAEFASVQPIFQKDCVMCHSANGPASFRPFGDFKQVAAVATPDMGETKNAWARVAHIHLQSISLILLGLGLLYSFCGAAERFKAGVIVLSFLSLFGDFGARALVPEMPVLVYIVMGSGATMALSMAIMILSVLYETWFAKPGKDAPVATGAEPAFGSA